MDRCCSRWLVLLIRTSAVLHTPLVVGGGWDGWIGGVVLAPRDHLLVQAIFGGNGRAFKGINRWYISWKGVGGTELYQGRGASSALQGWWSNKMGGSSETPLHSCTQWQRCHGTGLGSTQPDSGRYFYFFQGSKAERIWDNYMYPPQYCTTT
jgi:hypothetical protein